jgi:hypothetical protein
METQIENYNIAIQSNFKLIIPDAAGINYFLQSCNLPSVDMGPIESPYTNKEAFVPGNKVTFSPLNTQIILDEDFANYIYLHDWLSSFTDDAIWRELTKDLKLHILSANKHTLLIFTFVHAWPFSIGDISFTSSIGTAQNIVFETSFRYQYFEYNIVSI